MSKEVMMPKFLEPLPTKIVAVGLNYHSHARELGLNTPHHPIIFLKPTTAIIQDGEAIILPRASKRVDYEAELALVIGKRCHSISEKDALDYVKGFTCLNDVTARDLQKLDNQWTRAKSFDTFCPIGPKLIPKDKIDPNDVDILLRQNGKVRQSSNTSQFIFTIEKVIEFISDIMTLNKGDIITTGTPPGIGPIHAGDLIEVEIEGIGTLRNHVRHQ